LLLNSSVGLDKRYRRSFESQPLPSTYVTFPSGFPQGEQNFLAAVIGAGHAGEEIIAGCEKKLGDGSKSRPPKLLCNNCVVATIRGLIASCMGSWFSRQDLQPIRDNRCGSIILPRIVGEEDSSAVVLASGFLRVGNSRQVKAEHYEANKPGPSTERFQRRKRRCCPTART